MKIQMDTCDLDGVFENFDRISPSPNQDYQFYSIPPESGSGHMQRILLRDGLELIWFDAQFNVPMTLDVDVHYPHLEISYTMSGTGCWETSVQGQDFELAAGVSSIIYVRDSNIHAELSHHERMLHMELRLDLRHFNSTLPELDRMTITPVYCKQTIASPQIPLLVEQMKNCPYTGALQKLYLEGKALEMLTFHLDGMNQEEMIPLVKSKLSTNDIQCLYKAREILTRTWMKPPSLIGLARLTGLNDYKLKLGFKELFGTTVFGYVRGMRMNEARSILEQGKANVSETAMMVGYNNVSHFASLFRKTFGYNPSEFGKFISNSAHKQLYSSRTNRSSSP